MTAEPDLKENAKASGSESWWKTPKFASIVAWLSIVNTVVLLYFFLWDRYGHPHHDLKALLLVVDVGSTGDITATFAFTNAGTFNEVIVDAVLALVSHPTFEVGRPFASGISCNGTQGGCDGPSFAPLLLGPGETSIQTLHASIDTKSVAIMARDSGYESINIPGGVPVDAWPRIVGAEVGVRFTTLVDGATIERGIVIAGVNYEHDKPDGGLFPKGLLIDLRAPGQGARQVKRALERKLPAEEELERKAQEDHIKRKQGITTPP